MLRYLNIFKWWKEKTGLPLSGVILFLVILYFIAPQIIDLPERLEQTYIFIFTYLLPRIWNVFLILFDAIKRFWYVVGLALLGFLISRSRI